MSFWTLDRAAEALAGLAAWPLPRGSAELAGVTTDTRSISPGQLFVALVGERFDGHDYVTAAVAGGASAVVVSKPMQVGSLGVPVYVVNDTLIALGALASFWRRAWGRQVVAVAGSNGKTTTKDLICAALSPALDVHATTGNLNNRIGVPLTILGIPSSAEIAVVELGTNLPGEVAILRDISAPDIAIVTSVAEEHLEGLGDITGVLREETSCYEGVATAVAPSSQPEIAEAARQKARQVVTAGLDGGDVAPESWTIESDGTGTIRLNGVTVRPLLRGVHNLRNTMLAIAVSRLCGIADETAAAGIESMPVPRMRVAWEQIGRATVINDAYNSNPGSARAAIDLIRSVDADRQRVIVLGTMRELGDAAERCHLDVARLALESGADIVAGVGDFERALSRAAPADDRVVTAESIEALWPKLEPRIASDAVILLKASRGVQLERLLPHLTTWATT